MIEITFRDAQTGCCWVAINGSASNLTNWIASHPGRTKQIIEAFRTESELHSRFI